MRYRGLLARAHEIDVAVFRRLAAAESPVLDATLPRLSRAANHSRLWLVIAALLGYFGGRRGKRAALRGVMATTLASAAANAVIKVAVRRKRPDATSIPLARKLKRLPLSSSFPSGHSASAAAFATGVALEFPAAGVVSGLLAGGVGLSRVYTGVHYPGDVLMGFGIGIGAALATQRWWPRVVPEPELPTLTLVDAGANGDGVGIAVNAAAGSADEDLRSQLAERLPDAKIVDVTDGDLLVGTLRSLTARAAVLGIAGGDGSINAAAAVAHEHGMPLLVLPAGTLNHLARDLGIDSIEEAVEALEGCRAAEVDVASIDGRPFLNTASFGPYPDLVDEREKYEGRIGKWPALVLALVRVLRRSEPVEVTIDGVQRKIWMIFIGNCRYEPSGLFPAHRPRLNDGTLDVRIVAADRRFARTRLIVRLLTGGLVQSGVYEERPVTSLEVRSGQGPLRLSRDGETFDGSSVFRVEKTKTPLRVFVKDQSRATTRPTTNNTASRAAIPSPVNQGPASL